LGISSSSVIFTHKKTAEALTSAVFCNKASKLLSFCFATVGSAGAFAFACILAVSALAFAGVFAFASMFFFSNFFGCAFFYVSSFSNASGHDTSGEKACESSGSKSFSSGHNISLKLFYKKWESIPVSIIILCALSGK
jgi:hypothetical protein